MVQKLVELLEKTCFTVSGDLPPFLHQGERKAAPTKATPQDPTCKPACGAPKKKLRSRRVQNFKSLKV